MLTYIDDLVGIEEPEEVKLHLKVVHESDEDKVIFIIGKNNINVLDDDGKVHVYIFLPVVNIYKTTMQ